MFGDSLNDEHTLPSQFTRQFPEFQSFNYAMQGGGPHTTLALLQNHNLNEQVPPQLNSGMALFYSYHFHTDRFLGLMDWVGRVRTNDPLYKLTDNGSVESFGNFATTSRLTAFKWWVYPSVFLRELVMLFESRYSESSQKLHCGLINAAHAELKLQMGARLTDFYFVVSPFVASYHSDIDKYYKGVSRCLDPQIQVLLSPPNWNYHSRLAKGWTFHPLNDRHPTSLAHDWLARELGQKLQLSGTSLSK